MLCEWLCLGSVAVILADIGEGGWTLSYGQETFSTCIEIVCVTRCEEPSLLQRPGKDSRGRMPLPGRRLQKLTKRTKGSAVGSD